MVADVLLNSGGPKIQSPPTSFERVPGTLVDLLTQAGADCTTRHDNGGNPQWLPGKLFQLYVYSSCDLGQVTLTSLSLDFLLTAEKIPE